LEHAVLEHLQFAPLSRAELVRRTGAGDRRVQAALDELVAGTFVVRRPQDGPRVERLVLPSWADKRSSK
jgi:DNA-binding GntR family transcriptional regulator